MAQDIAPMEPEKAKCPCCGKPLLVDWQIATYSDGEDSFQFVGLRADLGKKKEKSPAYTVANEGF
jgi:hypothetical protein